MRNKRTELLSDRRQLGVEKTSKEKKEKVPGEEVYGWELLNASVF